MPDKYSKSEIQKNLFDNSRDFFVMDDDHLMPDNNIQLLSQNLIAQNGKKPLTEEQINPLRPKIRSQKLPSSVLYNSARFASFELKIGTRLFSRVLFKMPFFVFVLKSILTGNMHLKKNGVIFSCFFLKIRILTPEKCSYQAKNVAKGGEIISAFRWWLAYIFFRPSGFQNGVRMALHLNKLRKSSFLPILTYRIDFSRRRPIGIDNYHWKHHC